MFKLKLHVNGSVDRYKAWLGEKGLTQIEGFDYLDIFSPIVKINTTRVFMKIAIAQNWLLFQLDVNTVFLHGDLNEEVAPLGLNLPHPNMMCKIQRSLYGLK